MSETLDAIREKYPQYKDVSNDELTLRIGTKYPVYLEHDPAFAKEWQEAGGKAAVQTPLDLTQQVTKTLTSGAEGSEMGREQATAERVATGISAPIAGVQTLTKLLQSGAEGSEMGRAELTEDRLATGIGKSIQAIDTIQKLIKAGGEGSEMARAQLASERAQPARLEGLSPTQIAAKMRGGTAKAAGEGAAAALGAISQPLYKILPEIKAEDLEKILAYTSTRPNIRMLQERAAAGDQDALKMLQEQPGLLMNPKMRQFIHGVAGVEQSLANTANFFTSPLGIGTLGLGELPAGVAKMVGLAFTAQMASAAPEIAKELGTEFGKPAEERDYEKIAKLTTDAISTTGFTAMGGLHAITAELPRAGMMLRNFAAKRAMARLEALAPNTAAALRDATAGGPEGGTGAGAPAARAQGQFLEQITAASFTHPETGETTTGPNHPEAAGKQGFQAPEEPTQRHGPDYGFEVIDPKTGKKRIVSRDEAEAIARLNGQLKEEPKRGKLHSDEVNFYGEPEGYKKEGALYVPTEKEKGQTDAVHEKTSEVLRDVQQPQKPEEGAGQVPADVTGKEASEGGGKLPQQAHEVEPASKKIDRIAKLSGEDFAKHAESVKGEGGQQADAHRTGADITNPEDLDKLRKAKHDNQLEQRMLKKGAQEAFAAGDMEKGQKLLQQWSELSAKGQWFSEAIEGATGSADATKQALIKADIGDKEHPFPNQPPQAPDIADFDKHEDFSKAHKKYEEDLATWEAAQPKEKPLIFADGNIIHAITPNVGPDSAKYPWRTTQFSAIDHMPLGHDTSKTRLDAVKEHGRFATRLDKIPFQVEPLPPREKPVETPKTPEPGQLTSTFTVEGNVVRVTYSEAGKESGYGQLEGRVINYVEVPQEAQNKGLGTKIVQDLRSRGGEIGITTNPQARRIMEKAGAKEYAPDHWAFPEAPEYKPTESKTPQQIEGYTPVPVPEKFNTIEDVISYREKVKQSYLDFFKSLGMTEKEANKLFRAYDARSNVDASDIYDRLSPENKAKLDAFEEGKGEKEVYEFDRLYNPENLRGDWSKEDLSATIVTALNRSGERLPSLVGDRLAYTSAALLKLKEAGGTWSDIAKALDNYTTQISGSQGDKLEVFKMYGEQIRKFAGQQGIDLPQGELGTRIPGEEGVAQLPAPAAAETEAKPAEPETPSRSPRAINKDIRDVKGNIKAWKGQRRGLSKRKDKALIGQLDQKIMEAENKLTDLEGELSRVPKKPSKGGTVAQRQFAEENERVGDDILRFINEQTGKLMSWSAFKEKAKTMGQDWFNKNRSLYDDILNTKLPIHHNLAIYGGTLTPDQVAQAAFEAGKISEPDPRALWAEIKHASKVRIGSKAGETADAKTLAQDEQQTIWNEATKQNEGATRIEIDPSQAVVGDKYKIGDQEVAVIARDENTGNITIDGGKQFGEMKVKETDLFHVDEVTETASPVEDVSAAWNVEPEPEAPKADEPPKGPVDLFGEPITAEQQAEEVKHPELGDVQERDLTKAEQKEFEALTLKDRAAREKGGEPLTSDETKRYQYLTKLAGQKELLAEDTTAAIKGQISKLREKLELFRKGQKASIARAQASSQVESKFGKEAAEYEEKIKELESQIFNLNQKLPVQERDFNDPHPPKPPLWEGTLLTGQKMRLWGKAAHQTDPLFPDYIVEFAGDPRERHTQEFIEAATGKLLGDLLTEGMKFKTGQKVMVGEEGMKREGEIVGSGPMKDGVQHYFVKTNLGETAYPENLIEAQRPEAPKPEAAAAAPAEPEKPQKYRIGNNPQTYTLLEKIAPSPIEIENGEQPMRVRNDKTGKEEIVMEADLTPVKTRTAEDKAKDKPAKDLDEELRQAGLDPSVFKNAKEKREALKRQREKGHGPGSPALTQGPDPKAQIEQIASAMKGVRGRKVTRRQQIMEAFALGQKLSAARTAVGQAVAGAKAVGDYLIAKWAGYDQLDDLLKAKGELSAELEMRGWHLRQFAATVLKNIPHKADRAAIAKWVDSGGDLSSLQEGYNQAPAEYKQAYYDAMHLNGDMLVAAHNIRNYFDARLEEAMDAGVLESGVEDYLHRLYEKDPTAAQALTAYVQSGILSTNPRLAKKRVFDHDWEAERLGYKVVQDFLPRMVAYESSLSRAIAAREFIRKAFDLTAKDGRPVIDVGGLGIPVDNPAGVREANLIRPSFKRTDLNDPLNDRSQYESRDYPALRKWKWVSEDSGGNPIIVQGDVLIHPDFAGRIDRLLKPSAIRYAKSPVARAIGRFALGGSAIVKQTMLDLSFFHQVQIAVHAAEHRVLGFPGEVKIPGTNKTVDLGVKGFTNVMRDIDFTDPTTQGLLKGGVTLGGDYYQQQSEGLVGRSITSLIPGLSNVLKTYHEYLFQNFIPRIKMTMAHEAFERNQKVYARELASGRMSQDDIYHLTASQANAAFGELNYTMLERSKTMQDALRIIFLAPDFLEARGRFALQAITKHGTEQRVALGLGALTMWTMARVGNMLLDGQMHNEPENLFSVVYKNKSYGLRTVQGDILHLLTKPAQFWMSRLNPVYGRTLLEMASGRDYFGRKRSAMEQVWDFVSTAYPISLRRNAERGIMESVLNAFGVTARRFNDMDTAFKMAQKWKDKHGVTQKGEFIYDANKDPLRGLKVTLSNGDEAGAARELKKLLKKGEYDVPKLNKYFNRFADLPFTGSGKNDRQFYSELSSDDKKTVDAARQHKKGMNELWRRTRDQYQQASGQPAPDEETEPGNPAPQ